MKRSKLFLSVAALVVTVAAFASHKNAKGQTGTLFTKAGRNTNCLVGGGGAPCASVTYYTARGTKIGIVTNANGAVN